MADTPKATHVNRVTLIFDVASTKDGSTREVIELTDRAIGALAKAGIAVSYFDRAHKSVKRLDATHSPAHMIMHLEKTT